MILKHTGALFSMMSLLGCGSSGGGGVQEVFTVTTVADVAASLHGRYFKAYSAAGTVVFQLICSIEEFPANPPQPWDQIVQVVYLLPDASANTIAADINTSLDGNAWFESSVAGNVVTITCLVAGARTDAADIDTGFTITTTQQGSP